MSTTELTVEATTARYVYLGGKGKCHIETDLSGETVCGKSVPKGEVRTTLYQPSLCARCGKDEAARDAAEIYRKRAWEKVDYLRREARDVQRQGQFTVHRCRLCGTQHQAPNGGGSPFCMVDHHVAELEEIVVQGPAWRHPDEAPDA